MLSKLKLLLNITDNSKDELLLLLIDKASGQAINYTHNPHCIPFLESTVMDMVVFNYNRLSTEGLNSESYSGVSFSYINEYPETILSCLRAYRKLRVL